MNEVKISEEVEKETIFSSEKRKEQKHIQTIATSSHGVKLKLLSKSHEAERKTVQNTKDLPWCKAIRRRIKLAAALML